MRGLAFWLLLIASGVARAEWLRIASPSIEILTDSGEPAGRAVLGRLESLERIFRDARLVTSPVPLRVYLFASEGEFAAYRKDSSISGFYQSGESREFIAMYSANASSVAAHEYLHAVLRHTSPLLPHWFEEGTAEFYSNIEIGAAKVRVGERIPSRLQQLNSRKLLNAEELNAPPQNDTQKHDTQIFYAESWALVHMLNLSPRWSPNLPGFILALTSGTDAESAFRKEFHKTLDEALAELPGYLRTMSAATVAAPLAENEPAPQIEKLSVDMAALALGELALETGNRAQAAKLFSSAMKKSKSPAEDAALAAQLAIAEGRREDARRDLENSIAHGSRDAKIYFELAMLEKESNTEASRKRVDPLLERAVAIDPNFAEAQFLLGVHATDDGELQKAIEHLEIATRLWPHRSDFWHALGYAQVKLGLREQTVQSAKNAMRTAANEQEANMAESLAGMAEAPAAIRIYGDRQKGSDVITPPSWTRPKGDARIEGVLVRVACDGFMTFLSVKPPSGEMIKFSISDEGPGPEVVDANGVQGKPATLACGEQEIPVAIEYKSGQRTITRIEFLKK